MHYNQSKLKGTHAIYYYTSIRLGRLKWHINNGWRESARQTARYLDFCLQHETINNGLSHFPSLQLVSFLTPSAINLYVFFSLDLDETRPALWLVGQLVLHCKGVTCRCCQTTLPAHLTIQMMEEEVMQDACGLSGQTSSKRVRQVGVENIFCVFMWTKTLFCT